MTEVYQTWFKALDTDHDGRVSGGDAFAFFFRSGLPKPTLKRVWDLADANAQARHNGCRSFF